MSAHQTDATWRKSSYSNGGGNECIEVAFDGERAAIRDSKDPAGGVLLLPSYAWAALRQTCVK